MVTQWRDGQSVSLQRYLFLKPSLVGGNCMLLSAQNCIFPGNCQTAERSATEQPGLCLAGPTYRINRPKTSVDIQIESRADFDIMHDQGPKLEPGALY